MERIAIIGSGVSGLVAARNLHERADIVLFEADQRIGGHVNTVEVDEADQNKDRSTDWKTLTPRAIAKIKKRDAARRKRIVAS